MDLAIIADTHLPRGRRRLPDECVQRMRAADAILHAGDLMELEVLEFLQSLGPPVHAVRGNVDSSEPIVRLPLQRTIKAGGVQIGMIHDAGPKTGRLHRMRRRFPDADAVVVGHTHIPLLEACADGFKIFNPGSPTDRRRQARHTMGLAHVEDGGLTFELIALD